VAAGLARLAAQASRVPDAHEARVRRWLARNEKETGVPRRQSASLHTGAPQRPEHEYWEVCRARPAYGARLVVRILPVSAGEQPLCAQCIRQFRLFPRSRGRLATASVCAH